jgi:hypothetical protein
MKITREEAPTGGPNRTPREKIVPLNTHGADVEPEYYIDCSESEGWPWSSNPSLCTWDIQLQALRGVLVPFEAMDAEAAGEQAGGSDEQGGVYGYPFSNMFQPIGEGPDDGDLNSSNFDRKMAAFIKSYFDNSGKPRGGTEIMEAIRAGDEHFMGEFGTGGENEAPRDERPVRARIVWTDGALNDASAFQRYLGAAELDRKTGYGRHGEWDEVWAIAIIGPSDGGGKAAHQQYAELAKTHPWIHPYYFENVVNPDEIAEDIAVAVVPTTAAA